MSAKRKMAPPSLATSDVDPAPASKRRKLPVTEEETAEGTTKTGLTFLDHLKNARDKSNWNIATYFLTLPDRKTTPDYYQRIGLPMALDTIEAKLNAREYPNMTALEGDFRRMISNAKSFNEKRSAVFSDSEKVRKVLSRYMEEHNPAYRSPNHQAYTTPVPADWKEKLEEQKAAEEQDAEGDDDPEEDTKPVPRRTRLVTHVGSSSAANDRRASSTPAVQDAEGAFQSFESNTFQEAQEKIMTELVNYKDDDDSLPVFAPFVNLPSRTLVDYYKVIKNPVSLKSAQKAVRGIKGRDKPTGSTFLKSWGAFEEELSHIWENARIYNEDGSDISELAGELEDYFHRRLAEAKRVVAEPPQPRVKLRMPAKSPEPSKITLKFGGQKGTGSAAMSVDNEALKRQKDHVRAGANGHTAAAGSSSAKLQQRSGDSQSELGPSTTGPLGRPLNEIGGSVGHVSNGLKAEASYGQSPALNASQLNGTNDTRQSPSAPNIQMPPPMSLTSRLPSGSPHPQTLPNGVGSGSYSAPTPFNSRVRQPGKDISDALITNLNIRSHDGLHVKEHFSLDIPASPTRTQQSVTITIPYTHYYLSITPTVSSSLMHRPSKTVVSCANQRLHQVHPKGEPDPRRPVFEARVVPGVSAIEVEVIAGPPRGAPKVGPGQEIDFEKFSVFVHLQRT